MTEIGEGGFIELPLTILVLARLQHDGELPGDVVHWLQGVAVDRLGWEILKWLI